ncbi:MAG: GAF domain-containing protein [Deltaproteobacteria bacterium]|nr:GAF domain-containing protein [Deltaproteobacteria bacterium]MBW2007381.1 GAF domain-containing protein [Deltaproteobacteria bacterium]MBW2103344.1 GAF domain-containing protein [Deltaproteobacteria bacterium]MBW2346790.1 GAF domain-containing protein [Deltaproteobacteria bacterium]
MTTQQPHDTDSRTLWIERERDLFKAHFLKIQQSYEKKITELSIIKELGSTLRSTTFQDRNVFFWNQLKIINKYKPMDDISLLLLNEQYQVLELVARSSDPGPLTHTAFSDAREGPEGRAFSEKTPVVINDLRSEMGRMSAAPRKGSLLCMPILHKRRAIGVLGLHQAKTNGFDQNDVRFYSLVADQITTSAILFRLYHQMLKEEKQRFLLTRFFSRSVTEKIFGSGGNLRLGGERKTVSIMFADLRGFTSMSEELDQEQVVEILNGYFSCMTPIIFKNDGTLDKLMGDGILAFFGAPITHDDDPVRAVRTAVQMLSALRDFNETQGRRNQQPLEVSIGINAGEVVAGYIGSEDHLNYTVIGDAVNVAQRLQSIARGNEILVTRTVRDALAGKMEEVDGLKALTPLPAQKVKGRERAIDVFRVETDLC